MFSLHQNWQDKASWRDISQTTHWKVTQSLRLTNSYKNYSNFFSFLFIDTCSTWHTLLPYSLCLHICRILHIFLTYTLCLDTRYNLYFLMSTSNAYLCITIIIFNKIHFQAFHNLTCVQIHTYCIDQNY